MDYLQSIVDIAIISARLHVRKFVLSPGSRCAPLTLSIVRHPDLTTYVIPDERSAAYVALGMSQQTRETIGLVCTSGTAALNYAPAVAEAFYQQVPLLILTADRPPEWIDQQDGQAIRQQGIYGNHLKGSYQLPVSTEHKDAAWHVQRMLSEAIQLAQSYPQGPVQVNVPIREPFYPQPDERFHFDHKCKVIEEQKGECRLSETTWQELIEKIRQTPRVLLVPGQQLPSPALLESLNHLPFPIVSDIISNHHGLKNAVYHQDAFLISQEELKQSLQPDLLITYGNSVISKNLKLFLRKYQAKEHWHIQEAGAVADTYQSLTKVIRTSPEYFMAGLAGRLEEERQYKAYREQWLKTDREVAETHKRLAQEHTFHELAVVQQLLEALDGPVHLHLANSMVVRYANFVNLRGKEHVKVFANRGTSGIDGSSSTAVGHALANPGVTNILVTGDMAFFYDRNAFWHQYPLPNVKVFLMNNQGGVIFRMIDGPARQPELEEYFETKQTLEARHLAEEHEFTYYQAGNQLEFQKQLQEFLQNQTAPSIFEVKTDKIKSKEAFVSYKKHIASMGETEA
ncbi:2-succinyl-5-enolpyruvyl-6-hydroxy-3-cyclohexene-1-carboxylic-acid synthase [Rapidithrix thailandica]|uniref:2-succinyl-5-enolpyruvyl-6-hydroxy-3-cyclohexene-1-carboxylate synthase n=1 Tax=Rapidithrix thailandica TaxID=413964 RepID=A0AAW9S9Z7_9BACT